MLRLMSVEALYYHLSSVWVWWIRSAMTESAITFPWISFRFKYLMQHIYIFREWRYIIGDFSILVMTRNDTTLSSISVGGREGSAWGNLVYDWTRPDGHGQGKHAFSARSGTCLKTISANILNHPVKWPSQDKNGGKLLKSQPSWECNFRNLRPHMDPRCLLSLDGY